LETNAVEWEKNVRECHELATERMPDRYKAVRFEDLLRDASGIMSDVWRFLGVRSHSPEAGDAVQSEMARNPKAAWHDEADPDLVKGLQRGVREGWRKVYTLDDLRLFERIAGETLNDWGYTTNG
jgi:hypothetical protein